MIQGISDLPTLPDVVTKLNQVILSPDTSAGDINNIITQDISLSAKILKLVNSPFYGFLRRITTITYAVVILGFNTVRNLALSAFVFDSFKKKGTRDFDLKGFWRHCIGTAICAQAIARKSKTWQVEESFMAGLLYEVGKVVMNQHLTEDLTRVMQKVKADDCLFSDAENELLEYDHNQLGGLLLDRWNLPPAMVETARLYHTPSQAETAPALCAIVHFADIMSRALCMGFSGDSKIPRLDQTAFGLLKLSWDDVPVLMDQAVDEYNSAGAFFDLT